MRDHIGKENGVLCPLTDAVLTGPTMDALARAVEDVEGKQGPGASIEHAEAEVERLGTTLGVRVTRPAGAS